MVYPEPAKRERSLVYEILSSLKKDFFRGTGSFLTSLPEVADSGK
jgi:hypothetical protein